VVSNNSEVNRRRRRRKYVVLFARLVVMYLNKLSIVRSAFCKLSGSELCLCVSTQ